jgi:hypothetical protein
MIIRKAYAIFMLGILTAKAIAVRVPSTSPKSICMAKHSARERCHPYTGDRACVLVETFGRAPSRSRSVHVDVAAAARARAISIAELEEAYQDILGHNKLKEIGDTLTS